MIQTDAADLMVDIQVRRDGFQLDVKFETAGGVLVLFGPSGAGKSTTLQAVAGLVSPNSGEVILNGETLFRRGREGLDLALPARARRVGYVFQDYALFPHLTALGNVSYALWRQPGAEDRAADLLERMGLAGLGHRYPHELSGGQQQRVAIARALAAEPKALLLDEPFAALDLATRRQVRGEIRKVLQDLRLPVVLVTHDREEALTLGDTVAVMDQGRVIAVGEPLQLLGAPPRERVARVTGIENLLRLTVREVRVEDGLMRCGAGAFDLWAPVTDAVQGDEVTVALRADDVMLASQRPAGLSARNILPARVESVEQVGAVCGVTLDCAGVRLRANLSRGAVRELGVQPGAQVWAVVKSSSCVIAGD